MDGVTRYGGLRQWLEIVQGWGEVVRIEGAHWDGEIGALSHLARRRRRGPAVLFDRIVDSPAGHRILINALGSARRLALTLGLGEVAGERELMERWKEKWRGMKTVPPRRVKDGPVLENVFSGPEVDVTSFPAPRWHEGDGGRYLGTGCVVILRDPETGWVNVGTYRVQLQGKNRLTCFIGSTHHGFTIRQKYLSRGERCPVAIALGPDPLLFLAASAMGVPPNQSEYDYAGGIKGEPIPVVAGELTGLPVPSEAEVVMEGFFLPGEKVAEGPFGEFTGYYASGSREETIVEIVGVYHRSDPILLGSPPIQPPNESTFTNAILRSPSVEQELAAAGVPDVRGAWCHEVGAGRMLIAVAIKQRYPGHAKQVLTMATSCYTGLQSGKIVIVVDEDVDVSNLEEVMWVACTRMDPERDVEILKRFPGSLLDPSLEPGRKHHNSRLLIDATRPYEWLEKFAPTVAVSDDLMKRVQNKWGDLLG
jgi:4-hydroxy-3-polyprenylbenzoate decarboxylase